MFSSLVLFLCFRKDTVDYIEEDTPTQIFTDIFSFLVLFSLCVLLGCVLAITRMSRETLEERTVESYIGTLYLNLNLKKKGSYFFPAIFVLRKITMSLGMIFLQHWEGGQVMLLMYSNLFICMYR